MEMEIQLHRKNIFLEISEGSENERKFLENLYKEKIDPVTGEAHYYIVPVKKNRTNYTITIPRTEHTKTQFKSLENNDELKIIVQRDSDKYIVLKENGI